MKTLSCTVTHLTRIESIGPIASYRGLLVRRHTDGRIGTYLVLFDRLNKAATTCLLLALNEQHKIHAKSTSCQEIRRGTRDCENRALVVRCSTTIQVAVSSCQRKRIRVPTVGLRRYNVIMAVKEDAGFRSRGRLCTTERRQDKRIRGLTRR